MSRFNVTRKGLNTTVNHEGAKAYKMSSELELYAFVCTSTLSPTFYEPRVAHQMARLRELIGKCSPLFVAKLAVYAREKMYLRTIPLVLVVELAKRHKGTSLISKTVERIIQRADELTEILALYQAANDRSGVKTLNKLSNQIKKGVAAAFNKFDEYQFAKYNRDGIVSLKDALFLTHPSPKTPKQQEVFNKIVNGTLETPKTWEVLVSAAGNDASAKKAAWSELIQDKKLGYMATLRNLRNIINSVDLEDIEAVASYLSNPVAVENSKQLPFRFLSAFKEVTAMTSPSPAIRRVLSSLETAARLSVKNLPMMHNENVLIASDVSGSMRQPISARSSVLLYDIGLLMSMCAAHAASYSTIGIFGDIWKQINLPSGYILSGALSMDAFTNSVGYSTHGYKVLEWALKNRNVSYDTFMFFTDGQMYGNHYNAKVSSIHNLWIKYKKEVNPKAKLYLFNLANYGTSALEVERNGVHLISGWSDKIFDVLAALREGGTAVAEINRISI